MAHALRFLAAVSLLMVAGCQQQPPAETALPLTVTSKDFGAYTVHFNALTTDQLHAEVAQQYGIVRSNNRAMLNVSILRKDDGGLPQAVSGQVTVAANNLTGQLKSVPIREVREQEAIYYIGEYGIVNGETLIFSIDVTPIDEIVPLSVRYMKQFFVD
jgi:hypothetical protein